MNDSIARAKFIDKLMTAVLYCVAGFFILLLVAFALYVIINGFMISVGAWYPLREAASVIYSSTLFIWFSCRCW